MRAHLEVASSVPGPCLRMPSKHTYHDPRLSIALSIEWKNRAALRLSCWPGVRHH